MLSYKVILLAIFSFSGTSAAPVRREVPQEHSHNAILASVTTSLRINNPLNIADPVFGLLGNAAAAGGQGKVTDVNCLQQATADQAFTNAKAAGNVQGQVDALTYRALERNTGKVGLASAACTSIKAVNPQIAAISQHQDPASPGAAATNKAIVLALAQQISSVGGNPQDALKSGTFKPGSLSDTSGKGNTCDVQGDTEGCIFSQNLLVPDATADEINAAVSGGAGAGGGAASSGGSGAASSGSSTASSGSSTASSGSSAASSSAGASSGGAASSSTAAPAQSSSAPTASGANLQTFTGALGGIAPPTVTTGGAGFDVTGSDTFRVLSTALERSCDIQHNACANAANANSSIGFTVSQCDAQDTACRALN